MAFENYSDWRQIIKGGWLIYDADALISIIKFNAEELFEEFAKLKAKPLYTHPVLLELMNTDSPKEKVKRNEILDIYNFMMLPFADNKIMEQATRIQESFPINLRSKPSSTDLYLGATLAKYSNSKAYLLTSNTKDFPKPIYTREGFIPLHNDKEVKCISIVGIDRSKLID